jgi:putative membrane protein
MASVMTTLLADAWGWHHGDVGIGWWIVMMLGMIVFWGAIIALIAWLLRSGGVDLRRRPPQDPLDVLERRLADGSITVEEYEERRTALDASATRSS